jgi:hypothetical protein
METNGKDGAASRISKVLECGRQKVWAIVVLLKMRPFLWVKESVPVRLKVPL